MTAKLSREQFFRNLSDSGLFSDQDLNKARESISENGAPDGESAARKLVASGQLTPFQAEAVSERRFDGLLIGNYEVLDRLGQGGMGTVFKARHRRMRRIVAIKVLSRDVAQDERFIKRFQREVEAVARLSHPNIVMAHDADEAEVGHFLVMEFVNGRDLASSVEKQGPLPVRDAVSCIIQAARALDYAHGQGIIHRDIKPANLLRDADGVVKVADLGLARFEEASSSPNSASALTQAGAIMGTVDYMSPEQALGADGIDHRTDIYSLGCTLYFLLIGKPPYEGPSIMAILLKHREAPIPSLRAARAEIPAELDAVFCRMVTKSAGERYQTMTDVVHALESIERVLPQRDAGAVPVVKTASSGANPPADQWALQKTAHGATPAVGGDTVDLPPAESASHTRLSVLLVEPSRTQSAIIRKYLEAQKSPQVATAVTGLEALQAVRRERPNVLLIAFHLSDMSGVQLAEQVYEECKPTSPAFVLISSEAESAETRSLSKCGSAILLKKPFTSEQLGDALKLVTARRPPRPESADFSKLNVLIVDDSAPARVHVRGVLTGLGIAKLVEATDGARAVAALSGSKFDLIVTDYNMPHMDGRGLVGYLRENPATSAIPVIMVTTEDDPAKLAAVRRLGVAAVCDKSFPADVVRRVLEQVVKTP
jgi:serine/threonine protein kinase